MKETLAESPLCPLCGGHFHLWFRDHWRDYYQCDQCALVQVPEHQRLSAEEEKAHYDLHDNQVNDPAYRHFLSRLTDPLLATIRTPARGLDFGCGPGPALAAMLEENNINMSLYDLYYYPDDQVLHDHYELITATEVLEHLGQPWQVLCKLWSQLAPGGWLGVMTRRLPAHADFDRWHYRRDPTHISFYSEQTFAWLGNQWDSQPQYFGQDVALLQKPG